MNLEKSIKAFKEHQMKMHAYEHATTMLTYDASTSMPKGGVDTLGDTLAVLSEESYKLTVDKGYKEILQELYENKDKLDFQTRRETEYLHEEQEKMEKIPKEEVVALQVAQNEGNHYWEVAKKADDYEIFKPYLAKLIEMKKRYASYVKPEEKNTYNTLLDEFEKGMTTEMLEPFFDDLREKLVPVVQGVKESGIRPREDFLKGKFDISKQRELSEYAMDIMGVDKNRCILRETEHPFTIEFSKNDVRITTNYFESDFTSNLYSVIHESGHALYELNIGDDLVHSALGHGASTAIHESQSRLWENNIARSRGFCHIIFPKIKELFPSQMADVTDEEFYLVSNKAKPSLIRTEADELTYSMHVMVRYEIEKKIFAGEISVDEMPDEWNKLYKKYLDIDVPSASDGILQDAHWANGAFGYFPSYAVGNAYSAQITNAVSKKIDFDQCCKQKDFTSFVEYMTEHMYKYGMLFTQEELLEKISGEKFNPKYYTDYLVNKFSELYKLG